MRGEVSGAPAMGNLGRVVDATIRLARHGESGLGTSGERYDSLGLQSSLFPKGIIEREGQFE